MLLPVTTFVVLVVFILISTARMKKLEMKQKELEWKIESLERPMLVQADAE